ncbi:hypothetical protein E2C01_017614 [Portunus trituberculatus]|uniref:Uncharacterized protein n=1 Tax=Portunus trituberculatus TaxID=210409 RepID=A0A5B7DSF1_PORTR|nr:hypothetical protein [Portunus trituberculatus]
MIEAGVASGSLRGGEGVPGTPSPGVWVQPRAWSNLDETTSSHQRFLWAANTLQAAADPYLVCVRNYLDVISRQIGSGFTCTLVFVLGNA